MDWLAVRQLPCKGGSEGASVFCVSPYSVPDAVSGELIGSDRFRIHFRYIDGDEPRIALQLDRHVMIWIGVRTRRLLTLEVSLSAADPLSAARSALDRLRAQLIDAYRRVEESWQKIDNGPIASSALQSREEDLLRRVPVGFGHR